MNIDCITIPVLKLFSNIICWEFFSYISFLKVYIIKLNNFHHTTEELRVCSFICKHKSKPSQRKKDLLKIYQIHIPCVPGSFDDVPIWLFVFLHFPHQFPQILLQRMKHLFCSSSLNIRTEMRLNEPIINSKNRSQTSMKKYLQILKTNQ